MEGKEKTYISLISVSQKGIRRSHPKGMWESAPEMSPSRFVPFLNQVDLEEETYKVKSIGSVSQAQCTEGAKERKSLGPYQSILSFPGYPHTRPAHRPAPSQSSQAEPGGQPCKHKSHLWSWKQTIERMATQTSFVPCGQLSCLPSVLSRM